MARLQNLFDGSHPTTKDLPPWPDPSVQNILMVGE